MRQPVTMLPLHAYAVFDGGGVKGAALAGAYRAACERGVSFVGFGGTSAGSAIALMAAIGMSADEIAQRVRETEFASTFLRDGGDRLRALQADLKAASELVTSLPAGRTRWIRAAAVAVRERELLRRLLREWQSLRRDLGIYDGTRIRQWVDELIRQRFPAQARAEQSLTLAQLGALPGVRPLKIVATDLRGRRPRVYGTQGDWAGRSVADAVASSMCYPLVFCPVPDGGPSGYLVDGGVSSNLPLFLFEDERRRQPLPVFAFDLVPAPDTEPREYSLSTYLVELLDTAIEGGELIQAGLVRDLHHVKLPVPPDVGTLDFGLNKDGRLRLEEGGYAAATAYINHVFRSAATAENPVEALQAVHVRPGLVTPILRAVVAELEALAVARSRAGGAVAVGDGSAPQLRANVMLPTDPRSNRRRIVYQVGMDDDPDQDLEIGLSAGVSGEAFASGRAVAAAMPLAPQAMFAGLTQAEASRIRKDRRAVLAVPIRAAGYNPTGPEGLPIVGTLSVDSSWSLEQLGWKDEPLPAHRLGEWAAILGELLFG